MTHPYDDIDHRLILALRCGTKASEQALLAHFTRGDGRGYHLKEALIAADEMTAAAAALRAEIARVEAAEAA